MKKVFIYSIGIAIILFIIALFTDDSQAIQICHKTYSNDVCFSLINR